ncbi:hypothetical protein GCM10011390_46160 [Aureimonas endophytica]|uniref:Uncharacterized protein n=1 Tax=Aureimonas endophytica TaxID=2027858 RepID=A0A917A0T8_9HYPH|nr:hypothetical protein [Aureimonas endophytica]GGE21585.1 hypothetical protein GCM10011390_46160 [Aureimonas endophytica]
MGKTSILIDDGMKADLEREAARAGVSSSVIAEQAIGALLEARAAKRQAIEAAIADADRGVFVSREAMDRWVMSWGTDDELEPPKPDIVPSRG